MDDKRQSKTLIPPEAYLSTEDLPVIPKTPTRPPELSTPKNHDTNADTQANPLVEVPSILSNELDPIDLNIVNLESANDLRMEGRARSSPSIRVNKIIKSNFNIFYLGTRF